MTTRSSTNVKPTLLQSEERHVRLSIEGFSNGLPGNYGSWVDGGGTVPTNSWTHWALTFDGSSVRAYINGMVTRTFTGLTGTITPTTGPFRIGSRSANQITLALEKIGFMGIGSRTRITDTNQFHHVAVTKYGSAVYFYIDGVGENGAPFDPGFEFSPDGNFVIGAGGDYGASFLGRIDEV